MNRFAQLILDLENTSSTSKKLSLLVQFFQIASDSDKLWTIALFSHKRPKRQVSTKLLSQWVQEQSDIPEWLFQESYAVVGDLAETISLLMGQSECNDSNSLSFWINYLYELTSLEDSEKKKKVLSAWSTLGTNERFVFNKLITGGFRVGVSKGTIIKALSKLVDKEPSEVAHQLMGDWHPASTSFDKLLDFSDQTISLSRPYPFYLAYPLNAKIAELGTPSEWSAEWKWDGIRAQLIKRGDQFFIWSRGEELITDKFPELIPLGLALPNGTVIDGELLPFKNHPLPFSLLQTRIGRKNITKKQLEEAPAIIYAYDLIELDGKDVRNEPLLRRREFLGQLIENLNLDRLKMSKSMDFKKWSDLMNKRDSARNHFAEGLMLKKQDSVYKAGRKSGDWWKWKVDPLSIDAVMIYAQAGHGRRADLFSDFTFAVWKNGELISFAKAYSGLTDKELVEITKFVKANTKERFGPVRTVTPSQVFEIHFEGISESKRHKSGFAVRFPRIYRWRKDKKPEEANTIEDLQNLMSSI